MRNPSSPVEWPTSRLARSGRSQHSARSWSSPSPPPGSSRLLSARRPFRVIYSRHKTPGHRVPVARNSVEFHPRSGRTNSARCTAGASPPKPEGIVSPVGRPAACRRPSGIWHLSPTAPPPRRLIRALAELLLTQSPRCILYLPRSPTRHIPTTSLACTACRHVAVPGAPRVACSRRNTSSRHPTSTSVLCPRPLSWAVSPGPSAKSPSHPLSTQTPLSSYPHELPLVQGSSLLRCFTSRAPCDVSAGQDFLPPSSETQ